MSRDPALLLVIFGFGFLAARIAIDLANGEDDRIEVILMAATLLALAVTVVLASVEHARRRRARRKHERTS